MEKIAKLILWIAWNIASILAIPLYALKYELLALKGFFKEWRHARKLLKEQLMPKKKPPVTNETEE